MGGHNPSYILSQSPPQFSVDCVMIRSVALIKHRLVTDRHQTYSIYRAMHVRCICVAR